MKKIFLLLIALAIFSQVEAQTPLWQGKGRIAISSDGNEHDHDDWAATPMSLALLASQGLQNKLVLYTYSDHVWGSNQSKPMHNGMSAYEHMRVSALGGKEQFGFTKSRFMCAVDHAERAYNAMADVINKSSADDPLFIIAAGPMQVVGEALNRADKSKRQYVTVISHSWWNNEHSDWWSDDVERPFPAAASVSWDNHSGWTFEEMKSTFGTKKGGDATFIEILDQNGNDEYEGLQAPVNRFDWLLTSKAQENPLYKKGSWYWLYNRLANGVKNGKFDVSDAGMVLYLLTGVEQTNIDMVRELLENPK